MEQTGRNHLAKILAKKCSGKLNEVTERFKRPVFEEEKVEELWGEILMSAKIPKKDGKGYAYPVMGIWWDWKETYAETVKSCLQWLDFRRQGPSRLRYSNMRKSV